ncbi:acyltransferase family protein [Streptomyces sp. TS71-3]|uniref:acyltransferase family protein n=1 Tax=Streptomyces sp. TS71-3 TaxID=2733862 RepID=UPI001B2D10CD|nr:acyltransferase family protein [Streptomyces sp. TS71-3]GHJ37439.1 membrane protein [Streptomyces sp. TS71-3]
MSETFLTGPRTHPAPARDAYFDNAKYLAIVLVAMGHSWEPLLSGSRTVDAVYMSVYTFHMPAFILISGYFSRSFDARPSRLGRLVSGVAVPYVIFETAYALLVRGAAGDPSNPISLLDPWYLTWFLPALFVWRLTTPLWRTLRHPLPIALALAALASMSPSIGDDLDLQRVLQFLPFFVLGLRLRPGHLAPLRTRRARLATLPVLAAAVLVAYWAVPRMDYVWFYHDNSAQELGAPWWAGPAMTAGLLACSLALTACFLAWVPRRRTWFSALGTGTMYGYLLHGFLIKGALFAGWYDHPWLHGPLGEVAVTLAAGCAVTLLCTPPVRHAFRWVVEPRPTLLLHGGPHEPHEPHGPREPHGPHGPRHQRRPGAASDAGKEVAGHGPGRRPG